MNKLILFIVLVFLVSCTESPVEPVPAIDFQDNAVSSYTTLDIYLDAKSDPQTKKPFHYQTLENVTYCFY